jgi:hypothetical protein
MILTLGRMLLLTSICGFAFAGVPQSPEIDATSGVAAVALLAGGLVVLQTRRRRTGKK